jgi:hydroxymethylglutaryl-CoA lyase
MIYNKKISIFEMFMRDGLQSLPKIYSLNDKIKFIEIIKSANIKNIEIGSLVSNKLLPQMNETIELWNVIKEKYNNEEYFFEEKYNNEEYFFEEKYTVLLIDSKKIDNAIQNGITSYSFVFSLCDTFGIKNLRNNYENSFENVIDNMKYIFNKLKNRGVHFRIYISCFCGSIFSTNDDNLIINRIQVSVYQLLFFSKKYNIDYNNFDIVLCDTFGILNEDIFIKILDSINDLSPDIFKYISLHLHSNEDFYKNIDIALNYNIAKFDSSLLKIGGCPFAKDNDDVNQLKTNISTKKLAEYLENKGYDTEIDINSITEVESQLEEILYKT